MGGFAADLILYNARVITLNPFYPVAQLVAVRGGQVLAVSRGKDLDDYRGDITEVINCAGRTVIPAFSDAHCHLISFAESLLSTSLNQSNVHSIADIQQAIGRSARSVPAGSWIKGFGYHEFYLDEKRHPTRWDLDKATVTHPVRLTHQSGHAHVLNSLALERAGISTDTPEPPGGMIERDLATGEPNGILYGMGDYLAKVVPLLDEDKLERGIRLASEYLFSRGITSLQDASPRNNLGRWQQFRQWQDAEYVKQRVTMMVGWEALGECVEQGIKTGKGNSRLRLGAVKLLLDETRGQLNPPPIELNEKVFEAHRSGFQVALHAVEETTVAAAAAALEYALRKLPRSDHRHRIEHCSVCPPEMAERLASLGAVVVTQPSFVYYNGERYLATVPDEQRRHLYPVATLMRAGIRVGAGSDCPVVPADPLSGIYAAVTRRASTGQTLLPGEGVNPVDALRMYTEHAAYSGFEEAVSGSIAPGKHADLVVLSDDPASVAPEEILNVAVAMTVAGGEIVWRQGL